MPEGTAEGVSTPESFEEAVAAALEDIGEATPTVEDDALPAESNDPSNAADQASDDAEVPADQLEEDQFDFGDEVDTPEPKETVLYEVPNVGEVSADELVNGYMRHADYTQKTQELAAERKRLQEEGVVTDKGAANLWQALQEDPVATAAWLAKQAGLLTDAELGERARSVPDIKFQDAASIEAEVDRRVEERLNSDPRIQDAALAKVERQIDSEFAAIEQQIGKPLSDDAKLQVLNFAGTNAVPISIAFDALRGRSQVKVEASDKKLAKPARPKPAAKHNTPEPRAEVVSSFEEAAKWALEDLGVDS